MIEILDFAFTGYPVTDIDRARAFYEGRLGLKPATTFGEGTELWVEYELGAGTLAISNQMGDQWKPAKEGPAIALEVADLSAAVAALRAAGVRFYSEVMSGSTCSMVVVADPDGNRLVLHRRKPAAA